MHETMKDTVATLRQAADLCPVHSLRHAMHARANEVNPHIRLMKKRADLYAQMNLTPEFLIERSNRYQRFARSIVRTLSAGDAACNNQTRDPIKQILTVLLTPTDGDKIADATRKLMWKEQLNKELFDLSLDLLQHIGFITYHFPAHPVASAPAQWVVNRDNPLAEHLLVILELVDPQQQLPLAA